jgi:hypothetical protein
VGASDRTGGDLDGTPGRVAGKTTPAAMHLGSWSIYSDRALEKPRRVALHEPGAVERD